MNKKDSESIDAYHRKHLRKIIGKKYPDKISNKKLYRRCNEKPVSLEIKERRWKLFGHILRQDLTTPANKAMMYYFEENNAKRFPGRKRATIVSTINQDIKESNKNNDFEIKELNKMKDLNNMRELAKDQKKWKNLVKVICNAAEANENTPSESDANPAI